MSEQIHIQARKFLQEYFNDDELITFCFDYFPQVYNDFTVGMRKNQKVLMLISHSQRQERFEELLAALKRERPTAYQEQFIEKTHLISQIPQMPQVPKIAPRNPQQIFISHASHDAELAQRLAADLRANGWQTWIAPDNIKPGEKWVEAINRGLMESGIFVLLLTPDAVASRWVQSEMNVAIGMEHRGEIRLFPLNVKPAATLPLWRAYQWIAFDAGYDVGLAALLGELEPKEVPQPVVRAPHAVLPEKNESPAQSMALDTGLPDLAANPPPAELTKPNPLQAITDWIKTMPRQVLFGSGGVIVLLFIAWVLWPDAADNPAVEPTEVAEAIAAVTEEPGVEERTQSTERATLIEGPATATGTMTPSPTVSATPTVDPNFPPADAVLGARWVRPSDGMAMVFVSGGSFLMGSDSDIDTDAQSDEMPQREVVLSSFWLDRTEVTNEQFANFLSVQGNQTEGGFTWLELDDPDVLIEMNGSSFVSKSGFANHPVQNVSWFGAVAYCEWVGGALPTEAQWEYAARGPEGRIYPWGNSFDGNIVNFCDSNCDQSWADSDYNDGYALTAPVGSYSPAADSWVEAVDMSGNVWEWVADWYDDSYYADALTNNPVGPATGEFKVVRGGGWNGNSQYMRAADRSVNTPDNRDDNFGFRCVVPPG